MDKVGHTSIIYIPKKHRIASVRPHTIPATRWRLIDCSPWLPRILPGIPDEQFRCSLGRLIWKEKHWFYRGGWCFMNKRWMWSLGSHTCQKLPWIFPGAQLKLNGSPGNIQGNLTGMGILAAIIMLHFEPYITFRPTQHRSSVHCKTLFSPRDILNLRSHTLRSTLSPSARWNTWTSVAYMHQ